MFYRYQRKEIFVVGGLNLIHNVIIVTGFVNLTQLPEFYSKLPFGNWALSLSSGSEPINKDSPCLAIRSNTIYDM
jgi:hypothetical protein